MRCCTQNEYVVPPRLQEIEDIPLKKKKKKKKKNNKGTEEHRVRKLDYPNLNKNIL